MIIKLHKFSKLNPLLDVPMITIGPSIPQQYDSKIKKSKVLEEDEAIVISMSENRITSKGYINAIEGFGIADGEIELMVRFE